MSLLNVYNDSNKRIQVTRGRGSAFSPEMALAGAGVSVALLSKWVLSNRGRLGFRCFLREQGDPQKPRCE